MDGKTEGIGWLVREFGPHVADWSLRVFGAIVLVFAAYVLGGWVRRALGMGLARARLDETLVRFLANGGRWLVLFIAFVAVLGLFGIETASFAAMLGAVGVAIGLAFQGTLGNLASGVLLLAFRPFRIGDVIEVSGRIGKVAEVDLMTTALNTPDNKRIIIPNGLVFSGVITNFSAEKLRRADVSVGVEYGACLDRTREALVAAALSVEKRLADPAPVVVCMSLGDHAVMWQVRLYCAPDDYAQVLEAGTVAVKKALDGAGIGIPFPQLQVHLPHAPEAPR